MNIISTPSPSGVPSHEIVGIYPEELEKFESWGIAVEREGDGPLKMDHLFLGRVLLEEVVGHVVIAERKQSDDTRPSTDHVPAELIARPLPVCTDTQGRSQDGNGGSIAHDDGVVGILLCDVGVLLRALLRLLLGSLGLGSSLLGLSLEFDALGLRVGLYGLLLVVGRNGGDVG